MNRWRFPEEYPSTPPADGFRVPSHEAHMSAVLVLERAMERSAVETALASVGQSLTDKVGGTQSQRHTLSHNYGE